MFEFLSIKSLSSFFTLSTLFTLIPDFVFHAIFFTGLVGFIITSIPFIPIPLKFFYRIMFLIVLIIGTWLEGLNYANSSSATKKALNESKNKIKTYEKQIKDLSEASDKNLERIVKKINERGENVHAKVSKIIPDNLNRQCALPYDVKLLHNEAITGIPEIPNATRGVDGKSKTNENNKVELITLLETTVDNYTECNIVREKLIALQNWVKEAERLQKNVR
jgi:energy-coupling factor transporter transmembrane protein EcfT